MSTKRVFDQVSHKQGCTKPQKMARGLKFRIEEVEGVYYLCTAQLIFVFVFTFAESRFFNDAAQWCFFVFFYMLI